jgi:hypothetical protein
MRWLLNCISAFAFLFAGTFVVDIPNSSAQGMSGGRVVINNPRWNGRIVDHCRTWATDCGWGGANQYCRMRGFRRATNFTTYRPGSTYVIGSRRVCNGNFCVGFSRVICERRQAGGGGGPGPGPGPRAVINNPRWNGRIVDHCRTWATNCGAGGANYYCRLRGYDRAANFSTFRPGSTYVIGAGRVCSGGGCVGFSRVVCVGQRTGGVVPPPPAGGGGGGGAIVTINNPTWSGAVVDHCRTWATNCGAGGANQYCRRRGFQSAVNWTTYRPGRTFVIGSNRYCNGGGCVGFRMVRCRR